MRKLSLERYLRVLTYKLFPNEQLPGILPPADKQCEHFGAFFSMERLLSVSRYLSLRWAVRVFSCHGGWLGMAQSERSSGKPDSHSPHGEESRKPAAPAAVALGTSPVHPGTQNREHCRETHLQTGSSCPSPSARTHQAQTPSIPFVV